MPVSVPGGQDCTSEQQPEYTRTHTEGEITQPRSQRQSDEDERCLNWNNANQLSTLNEDHTSPGQGSRIQVASAREQNDQTMHKPVFLCGQMSTSFDAPYRVPGCFTIPVLARDSRLLGQRSRVLVFRDADLTKRGGR
eukprot:scpid16107/ scgid34627/ 